MESGVKILLERIKTNPEEFLDIVSDSNNLNHTIIALIEELGEDIKFLRDPTRGGLASVLNELAEIRKLGFAIKTFNNFNRRFSPPLSLCTKL